MKTTSKLATGLARVTLSSGCVVTSVCPCYTAKKVVFDPGLVGARAASRLRDNQSLAADERLARLQGIGMLGMKGLGAYEKLDVAWLRQTGEPRA